MPALMGLGSIALVCGRRWLIVITIVVAVVGIFGSVLLLRAHLSAAALTSLDGGAGDGVLQAGAWLAPLISLNSFGALAVFVVAVLSALKKFRQRAEGRFFYGNLWLAIGILIISAAGSAARLGWPQSFWVTMLIGWIVTFAGYRMLSRPAELPRQTVASDVGLWS
ncbi:MAG: hypothetical protein K6T83_11600 [Alicyclobacillus sp.]|nr:hypothetical protein [Alicyclobacillus sp.]